MGCQYGFCVNKILHRLQQGKSFQMTLKSSAKFFPTNEQTEHLRSELNVGINGRKELLRRCDVFCQFCI